MTRTSRRRLVRARIGAGLVLAGAVASLHSLRETLGHVGDDRYRDLDVPQGHDHVRYHLSREGFSTAGAMGAAAVLAVARVRDQRRASWVALASAVGGYLAGQWSAKPITGSAAPTRTALTWHVVTAGLLAGGVALLGGRDLRAATAVRTVPSGHQPAAWRASRTRPRGS